MPILKWEKYYILFLAHMFHLKRVRKSACPKNPQGAPRGGPKYHPDQLLCENRICRGFRLFCQCQFWNETSIIYFSWLTCSIWRESELVLVEKIPRGPPGGAKVPPGPYAEKNFVSKNGVQTTQNALIYLNPLSWKTLLWKKTQIFHPDQFLCKNRICRRFRLFCQCQFWNETSIISFS